MTVPTLNSVAEFVTNGVTTNFPFYFKFFLNEDLVVTYINPQGVSAVLTLGTQYTVNGAGDESGGSVVTSSALAGPGQLTVSREMDPYQLTSLRNQGKFLAETHEDVFDRLTMFIQQGFSRFYRALIRPLGRDYYDAENRRIANLADPVEAQDAATRSWAMQYVSSILATGQGPVNNAANVIYALQGGVSRTVYAKLKETLSVTDFGAKCDGVTDDTVFCQLALNFAKSIGGARVRFPAGVTKLTSDLVLSDSSISIVGDGQDVTILRFVHAGNGFSFTDSSATSTPIHAWSFEDMTIAKDGTGGYGISCIHSTLASNPTIPHLNIRNVLLRGYSDITAQYWARGIYEKNGSAITIENVSVIANGPDMETAIYLDNDTNASRYNLSMRGLNLQGGQYGIQVKGHCENVRITDYEIVGQGTNIFFDGTGTTIPGGQNPVCIVSNGHSNCKSYGIRCFNWKVLIVTGADIYSGVGTGDTAGANINVSNGQFVSVVGCKLGTGAVGVLRQGIELTNVKDSQISANFEFFTNGGVVVDGTVDNRLTVFGSNFFGYSAAFMSSGIYIAAGSCRSSITGNTFENCTIGVQGVGSNSNISDNNFKACTTDIVFSATAYSIGDNQSTNTPIKMTLSGAGFHRKLITSATVDPASIATGARTTTLVSVPGALLGDIVSVAAPYDIQDLTVTASVQNTGFVGIYITNSTGSTKDLASGIWTFKLER